MGLVSSASGRRSRHWGWRGLRVATFAVVAATFLWSFAPVASAGEVFGSPVQIGGGTAAIALGDFAGTNNEDIAVTSGDGVGLYPGEGGGAFAAPVFTDLPSVEANVPIDTSDIATLPNPTPGSAPYAAVSEPNVDSIAIGTFVTGATASSNVVCGACKPISSNPPPVPVPKFVVVQQLSLGNSGCQATHIAVLDYGGATGDDDFAVQCANPTSQPPLGPPGMLPPPPTSNELVVVVAAPPSKSGGNPAWAVAQTLFASDGSLSNITTATDSATGSLDIIATTQPLMSSETVEPGFINAFVSTGVPGIFSTTPIVTEVHQDFFDAGLFDNDFNGLPSIPLSMTTATLNGSSAVIPGSVLAPGLPSLVAYSVSDGVPTSAAFPTSAPFVEPTAMATGLLDGNSFPDVAVAGLVGQSSTTIAIDTGDGTAAFTPGATLATGLPFPVFDMQVGDLNGDGLDDIAYSDGSGLFVLYQDPPVFVKPIEIGHGPVKHLDETQPVASDVGLLIQRRGKPRRVKAEVPTPTGTKRVSLEVPTFIKVGKIPLGHHHKGHNTIRFKLLVNGHQLAPGSYIVTLRSLNAKKQVLDLSQPVTLTVDRHGHAHFGKHVLV